MRRLGIKLGVALVTLGTLSGMAVPSVASAKQAPSFKNSDLQRYYKSAKSKTAFHFKSVKSGKHVQNYLVLGDFGKQVGIRYGVPTTTFKLSNRGRTLSCKYRLINFKTTHKQTPQASLSKKTYNFKLTKKSATKFTTKLSTTKQRYLSTSGKTYTYTLTKKNPAKSYANKYAKPTLTKQVSQALDIQYPDVSAAERQKATTKQVNQYLKTLVANFNLK